LIPDALAAALIDAPSRCDDSTATRNLGAVQMLLSHESIATTERYTAVDDSEIRAAMIAAGDLDNSDERLPSQHAMTGTS
jgi:integrase